MRSDYLPDDLNTLWKELNMDVPRISADQLRREAENLDKGLRRSSLIGSGAGWLTIAGFTLTFFLFHDALQRAGCVLTVLGAAYILAQLRLRAARERPRRDRVHPPFTALNWSASVTSFAEPGFGPGSWSWCPVR